MNTDKKKYTTENIQQLHHDLKVLNSEYETHGTIGYLADYFKQMVRPVVNEIVSDQNVFESPICRRLKSELQRTITLLSKEKNNSNAGKICIYCERIAQFAFENHSRSTRDKIPDKLRLPSPKEVAKDYYDITDVRNLRWQPKDAEPVMAAVRDYINDHPDIGTITGHVKKIRDICTDMNGGRDAKTNWIEFYAEQAGYKKL